MSHRYIPQSPNVHLEASPEELVFTALSTLSNLTLLPFAAGALASILVSAIPDFSGLFIVFVLVWVFLAAMTISHLQDRRRLERLLGFGTWTDATLVDIGRDQYSLDVRLPDPAKGGEVVDTKRIHRSGVVRQTPLAVRARDGSWHHEGDVVRVIFDPDRPLEHVCLELDTRLVTSSRGKTSQPARLESDEPLDLGTLPHQTRSYPLAAHPRSRHDGGRVGTLQLDLDALRIDLDDAEGRSIALDRPFTVHLTTWEAEGRLDELWLNVELVDLDTPPGRRAPFGFRVRLPLTHVAQQIPMKLADLPTLQRTGFDDVCEVLAAQAALQGREVLRGVRWSSPDAEEQTAVRVVEATRAR